MAIIPKRSGYVQPQVAPPPQANPSAISQLSHASQNFAASMGNIAALASDARDKDYVDSTVAELQNRFGERFIKAKTEAGTYPDKFADNLKSEFDKSIEDALKNAPNDHTADVVRKHMKNVVGGYKNKALIFEANAIGSFHNARLGETLDAHLKTVFRTPEDAPDAYALGLVAIDNKADVLSPHALQAQRDAWKGKVYGTAFEGFLDTDPRAALKEVESGAWDDVLSSGQIQKATAKARQKVKMLDAEAAAADKSRLAELRTTVTLSLADEKAARAAGKDAGAGGVTDEMVKTAYGDQPDRAQQILGELEVLERVAGARTGLIAAQTVEDEKAIIANFAPAAGEAYVYAENAQAQDALRAIQRQKRQALQNDPIGYSAQTGLVALSPFDPTDANAVKARVQAAKKVQGYYRLPNMALLTGTEPDWLANTFKSADNAQRVKMLETLSTTLDRGAYQALAAQMFGKDQPFMGAVAGIAGGGQMELARRVLEGADIRRAEKTILPKSVDTLPHINTRVGDAFRFLPALKPAYTDAALALYAYDANDGGDRSAIVNTDRLNRALDRVTGGIVTWNGVKTLAPMRGMDDDAMENAMNSLTDAELQVYGNGQPMTLSGHAVTAQHIRDYATMAVVGPNRYAVLLRGSPLMVAGDGGVARYTIDLNGAFKAAQFGEGQNKP